MSDVREYTFAAKVTYKFRCSEEEVNTVWEYFRSQIEKPWEPNVKFSPLYLLAGRKGS